MNEHSHLKNLINLGFIVDEKLNDRIENLTEEEFYRLIESLKNFCMKYSYEQKRT